MVLPAFEVEAVVEAEFFAFGDEAEGDDPDAAAGDDGFAVGFAGVVDEAGGIPVEIAVEVVFFVEDEEVDGGVAGFAGFVEEGVAAAVAFGFGDFFA